MSSIIMLLASLAMATAVIQQQPGPVYHRTASVVTSSPSGKSLPIPITNGNMNPTIQNPQVQQPIAEERESAFQTPDAVNGGVGVPASSIPASSAPAANPQTFKIVYYPNSGQLREPTINYPATYGQNNDVSFWQRYRLNEILVGVASFALVAGGVAILYPKFVSVRARALRELADIDSEDAARMTKSVFKALERLYEMNNTE